MRSRPWIALGLVLAVVACKKKGEPAEAVPDASPPPPTTTTTQVEPANVPDAPPLPVEPPPPQEDSMALKVRPDVADRLARYAKVPLGSDLTKLGEAERAVLHELRKAADVMGELAFVQTWSGNPAMRERLAKVAGPEWDPAKELFDKMGGPWDRQADYLPFLGEAPHPVGSNFYPEDLTKEEFESWISAHADQAAAFKGFFTLIQRDGNGLVAVPYSEAYRPQLEQAAQSMRDAAALIVADEPTTLQTYLRSRADALLSNDYYESDLAWLALDGALEVVLGPYETYDDGLLGYKASFEAFLCVVDPVESEKLAKYTGEVAWLESRLPIPDEHKNTGRGADVPIKVVDQVYAAGQAGVMTIAFNLPNDERVREAKGFKNVLMRNVMLAKYDAILVPIAERVLPPELALSLSPEAFVNFVLFHEISHGLGPGKIKQGDVETEVRAELRELYPTLEEAKADILSLYVQQLLAEKGVMDAALLEAVPQTFVAGIFRTARFGISEAHGQGVLVQVNYLMEQGGIVVTEDGRFAPVADKFWGAVRDLARDLLMIQALGDYEAGKAFIEKYGKQVPPAMLPLIEGLGAGLPVDITPVYAEF